MNPLGERRVVEVLLQKPAIAEVLAEHGIVFCPGCYVALTSTLKDAADYNAVRDVSTFLRQLADALDAPSGSTPSP